MLAHPGVRRLHRRGTVRWAGVAVPSTSGSPGLTDGGIRVGQGRRGNRCWHIQACDACTGAGLYDGLEWLSHQLVGAQV